MNANKIVVIGAGPAGMMAAIRAGGFGQDTTLVEKNPYPGRKLLLSGKGRCNLTNACDLDSFIKRFSGNGQFLRDAFRKFFNLDLMRFFEARGLALKTERQLRVFPSSNRSNSVLEVLKKELQKNKVKIIYNSPVKGIVIRDNKVKEVLLGDGKVIPADRVILATGGVSYSFTGSTGDGIKIAQNLGHRVVALGSGLVPLETKQLYPRLLEGLALKNIRLKFSSTPTVDAARQDKQSAERFSDGKKQIVSAVGELLFTRNGISGPLVLSLSGQVADWLEGNKNVYVEIDLKPALSKEQLHARLLKEFQLSPKKSIKNTIKDFLPKRLVDVFIRIAGIPLDAKVSQINRSQRESIVSLFKGWRLDIAKARPIDEAMITRGGVSLKDINPRTMESRLIKGLYFAGEIMDIDADTGGFNLQAAFSTGYLAGESAALN